MVKKEFNNSKDIPPIRFFCVRNNKEETKILKFSQKIPLIDSNESLVTINIEPDKFRGISFNPLEQTNKK